MLNNELRLARRIGIVQKGVRRAPLGLRSSQVLRYLVQRVLSGSAIKLTLQTVRNLDPTSRHKALKGWHDFASAESTASSPRNGFSMAQEARNTERHISGWGSARLRNSAVSFVSAGTLTREEPQSSSSEEEGKDTANGNQYEGDSHFDDPANLVKPEEEVPEEAPLLAESLAKKETDEPSSVAAPLSTAPSALKQEEDLGSDSSSEAEEILFHGRGKLSDQTAPKAKKFSPTPANSTYHKPDTIAFASKPVTIPHRSHHLQPGPVASSSEGPSSWTPKHNRAGRLGKRRPHHNTQVSDEEEAIMQDYIANMAVDDDEDEDEDEPNSSKPQRRNQSFRFYDGAGDENVKVQTRSKLSTQITVHDVDRAFDWDSADLEDFDDLATTDEEINDIGQVLRHRERESGAQYLVTAIGKSTSDAKWLLHSKLTSTSAVEEIQTYHEIQTMKVQVEEEDVDSSSDDDEDALDDLIDDIESEDDENARVMLRTAKMSDAQLARALAKQEELGIGGDELILFDGHEDEDDEDPGDDFRNGAGFVPFSVSKHTSNRTRSKHNRRQRNSFPSAEAFADALEQDPYGGFDVMDFDRPSVRPKRKGKANDFAFDFELSDDDLAEHMKSTWLKDREKKTERKREKLEALEAQLLDAAQRSHPAAIKAEIRRFLVEETDILKLAPMDSHIRAGVHRLAKSLKLNSRSEGKEGRGVGRYPVLTKTEHTPQYTISNVWQIDALMESKKFFPKHTLKSFKAPKTGKVFGKTRGGGGGADAGLKNGDIVGAWAPELSADNKGRAMLEKMGWTSGMGIGAVGNEGSLEAPRQIVKTNKAGLG